MAEGPNSARGTGSNKPGLSLHVPEPKFRPGDAVDFGHVDIGAPGKLTRPDESCPPAETGRQPTLELHIQRSSSKRCRATGRRWDLASCSRCDFFGSFGCRVYISRNDQDSWKQFIISD